MLPNYEDILSRIAEPPRWFDEQGVPRYCEFAPHRIANIYSLSGISISRLWSRVQCRQPRIARRPEAGSV